MDIALAYVAAAIGAFWGGGRASSTRRVLAGVVALSVILLSGCAQGFAPQPAGTANTPTASPAAGTPTPSSPGPRTFTVIGTGDILLHSALWDQAARDAKAEGQSGYDFRSIFASVKPALSAADLAICHIESQFGPPNGPFHDYPTFSVPPQVATAIADAGYDTCSTASNHSLDYGEAGIDRTLAALDAVHVGHTGSARSPLEAATPDLLDVRGVKVAQLSYTSGFNGLSRPPGKEWLANLIDPDRILAEAHAAKQFGAEVVIVSLHWGTEYSPDPDSQQLSLARRLLASPDIDLILGDHVHVVQPIEKIGDKWVAYGMGNEVAFQNQAQDTRDGIMPRFTFTEVRPSVFRVNRAEVLPIHMWLDSRPARLYDVAATLADPDVPSAIKASCAASRARTLAVLGRMNGIREGLIVH
jgi:poly-gamma-glutamate synthesis protein (capsule biosynthesis protein)